VAERIGTPRVLPVLVVTLCLLIASLPFELPDYHLRWEVPQLAGALFLACTFLQPVRCYGRVPAPLWWLGGFMFLYCALILAHGWVDTIAIAQETLLMVQALLIFWSAANLLAHDGVAEKVLWAFIIACLVRAALPLVGIGRTGETVWTGGERITAFGQNANASAKLLAAGVLCLLGLAFGRAGHGGGRAWRLVVPAGLALLGIAIVDTGSRGSVLALGAGLLAFLFGRAHSRWARVRNGLIAVLALGFLIEASMRTEVMRNRFEETATTGRLAGREFLFPTLWQMFLEKPLAGWGPLNNQYEVAARTTDMIKVRRDSHNLLLELLTAEGALGALPFLVALALCVAAAWRARRGEHGMLATALLLEQLAGAISGNPISSKMFWLVLAYGLAAGERARAASAAPAPAPAAVPGLPPSSLPVPS